MIMWKTRALTKPLLATRASCRHHNGVAAMASVTTTITMMPITTAAPARHQRASFHHIAAVPNHATSPSFMILPNRQQQQQQQAVRWFESEAAYHIVADETLEGLQDAIEQALESLEATPDDMDISLASGVLTVYLPPHGTWVLNKQTPNQQIWWSSPLSGPKRFEYAQDGNLWFATQNGLSLVPLLAQELSHVLKTEVELQVD